MEIKFTVPSIPVAQPRQRTAVRAGHAVNYTPTKHPVNQFKALVQMAANAAYNGPPLEGPLMLQMTCVLRRPGKLKKRSDNPPRYDTRKPDLDNLMKSVADSLNGLLYKDDAQIAEVNMVKTVAAGNEQPHVKIAIGVLDDDALAESWRNYGR